MMMIRVMCVGEESQESRGRKRSSCHTLCAEISIRIRFGCCRRTLFFISENTKEKPTQQAGKQAQATLQTNIQRRDKTESYCC